MIHQRLRNFEFVLLGYSGPTLKVPTTLPPTYCTADVADKHDGNVGVLCRKPLWIVDIDEPDIAFESGIMKHLPFNTFTVKTAKGKHYYYLDSTSSLDKAMFLKHDGKHYGEIRRGNAAYVVGPGSLHASGVRYEIIKDVPIVEFSIDYLMSSLNMRSEKKKEKLNWKLINKTNDITFDMSDLVHIPSNARETRYGHQFEHPIHGSSNGMNFSVSNDYQVFWCWRCGHGPDEPACGNAVRYLALQEGIITSCDEKLSSEQFQKTMEIARKKGLQKDAHVEYRPTKPTIAVRKVEDKSQIKIRKL